jgi:LCCL domain-containing protein
MQIDRRLHLVWVPLSLAACVVTTAAAPPVATGPAGGPPPAASAPAAPPTSATCTTSGRDVPGDDGSEAQLVCPAGCEAEGEVRGTISYTGSSVVCRAAIHAGAIPAAGGVVSLRKDPGRRAYRGTVRNGIKSEDDGGYPTGFSVIGPGVPPAAGANRIEAGCSFSGRDLRGEIGETYVVSCPAGCNSVGHVQGSGGYGFESSICRAAIHASLLNDAGGDVKVIVENAHNPYRGSLRNGVRSENADAVMGGFRLAAP